MPQLIPPDPDEKRFYRHLVECFTCQIRSEQDGRLCSVGNELAHRRAPSPSADAHELDDRTQSDT